MNWYWIIVLTLCFSGTSSEHDFYISKTTLHYKEDQGALQITLHTFIDDMELALKSYEDLDYKLLQEREHALADSVLNIYFREHVRVSLDGQPIILDFLGKEMSDDLMGLWAYLEVENVSKFQTLEITNSLLMDTYEDQKNIIHFKVNNKSKEHHMLSKGDEMRTIEL